MDADGNAEVIVIESGSSQEVASGTEVREVVLVSALRAADGAPIWTVSTGVDYSSFSSFSQRSGELLRPLTLRATGQQTLVVIPLPASRGKVVVCGAAGIVGEHELGSILFTPGVRICDVQGDGLDEVVFLDGGKISVAAPNQLDSPLWTRDLGGAGRCQLLQVHATPVSSAAVIAIATDPTDNTVLGLNAPTAACCGAVPARCRAEDGFTLLSRLDLLVRTPTKRRSFISSTVSSPIAGKRFGHAASARCDAGCGATTLGLCRQGYRRPH